MKIEDGSMWCNLYVPIESKTPSQVLFNLFFIPTALPITIQWRVDFSIHTISIANVIRARNVTHVSLLYRKAGPRGREGERREASEGWREMFGLATLYKSEGGRKTEKGYDLVLVWRARKIYRSGCGHLISTEKESYRQDILMDFRK